MRTLFSRPILRKIGREKRARTLFSHPILRKIGRENRARALFSHPILRKIGCENRVWKMSKCTFLFVSASDFGHRNTAEIDADCAVIQSQSPRPNKPQMKNGRQPISQTPILRKIGCENRVRTLFSRPILRKIGCGTWMLTLRNLHPIIAKISRKRVINKGARFVRPLCRRFSF